jgi:teichuronic acid biosynthesis glycosyltransferase TuaG
MLGQEIQALRCVDVVIPFYKETLELKAAVSSCLLPGNDPFVAGIFVVCDGPETIYDWAKENVLPLDSRITLLRTAGAQGSGSARNVGLDAASAEFIAFLDSDDLWLPGKLAQQVKTLRESGAGGCCTTYVLHGRGLVVPRANYESKTHVFLWLRIGASTVMLRQERLRGLRFTTRRFSQDMEFWASFVSPQNPMLGLEAALCVYHPSARTGNKLNQLRHFNKLVRDFNFSLSTRIAILCRYAVRGVFVHFFTRFLNRL